MTNIMCPNKKKVFFCCLFVVFCNECWQEKNASKMFSLFQIFFSFLKQIEKMGWKAFEKLFTPFSFICLNFIGLGGNENLKKYLAWPYL